MSHSKRSVNLNLNRACSYCGERESRPSTFYCSDECRFWSKVNRGPGCWLWTASRRFAGGKPQKYGQFTVEQVGNRPRKCINAHVYSYILANGPVPDGMEVMHLCHNGTCVRPDHLAVGTHLENVQASAREGHYHVPRPNRQKLTPEQIEEIRARVNAGELRYKVAADYDIAKGYITQIMNGTARRYDAPLRPSLEQVS